MRSLLLAGCLVAGLTLPAHANSITNPGFESGFSGWTIDPANSGSVLFVGGKGSSGSKSAWFGAIGAQSDTISQTFATVPGDSYVITFWLGHGATDHVNNFKVLWDSTPLLTLINASQFGLHPFSFVTTAHDDQTTLSLSGRELLDFYYLDNVSVVPLPTPEPTTIVLLGGAALCAGAARLRARRAKKP